VSLRWLKPGDWVAGLGGAVLLVSLFVPWYSVGGRKLSGWQAFTVIDLVLALVALVGIALAVATAVRRTPAVPVAFGVLGGPAGALAALLVLIRLVDRPIAQAGLSAGTWVALAGALAVAAGAWWSLGDERNRGVPAAPVELRPTPPAT
jgi:hypothetical protein